MSASTRSASLFVPCEKWVRKVDASDGRLWACSRSRTRAISCSVRRGDRRSWDSVYLNASNCCAALAAAPLATDTSTARTTFISSSRTGMNESVTVSEPSGVSTSADVPASACANGAERVPTRFSCAPNSARQGSLKTCRRPSGSTTHAATGEARQIPAAVRRLSIPSPPRGGPFHLKFSRAFS